MTVKFPKVNGFFFLTFSVQRWLLKALVVVREISSEERKIKIRNKLNRNIPFENIIHRNINFLNVSIWLKLQAKKKWIGANNPVVDAPKKK